jgi:four helix bundle protein
MSSHKQLLAYKKAFELSIMVFSITKNFPKEERYPLIDQIRRSTRSVCTNLAEANARRKYKDYFLSKITDCVSENSETEVWLDFSFEFKYINQLEYNELLFLNTEVGKLLWYMFNNPDKFL